MMGREVGWLRKVEVEDGRGVRIDEIGDVEERDDMVGEFGWLRKMKMVKMIKKLKMVKMFVGLRRLRCLEVKKVKMIG